MIKAARAVAMCRGVAFECKCDYWNPISYKNLFLPAPQARKFAVCGRGLTGAYLLPEIGYELIWNE